MRKRIQSIMKLLSWQGSKTLGTESIETNTDQTDTSDLTNQLDTRSTGSCIRTCEELMYDVFIRIIVGGDLTLLAREGKIVEETELHEAWQDILNEYSSLIATPKASTIAELWKKIVYTNWKITLVDQSLAALKIMYSEPVALALVEAGFDYIASMDNRQLYLQSIYRVQTTAKFLVVQLNQYYNEYKALVPEGSENEMPKAIDYEKELIILSKHMGFRIIKTEITVAEFCAICNVYLDFKNQENGRPTI